MHTASLTTVTGCALEERYIKQEKENHLLDFDRFSAHSGKGIKEKVKQYLFMNTPQGTFTSFEIQEDSSHNFIINNCPSDSTEIMVVISFCVFFPFVYVVSRTPLNLYFH